jgi:hypothetical protein
MDPAAVKPTRLAAAIIHPERATGRVTEAAKAKGKAAVAVGPVEVVVGPAAARGRAEDPAMMTVVDGLAAVKAAARGKVVEAGSAAARGVVVAALVPAAAQGPAGVRRELAAVKLVSRGRAAGRGAVRGMAAGRGTAAGSVAGQGVATNISHNRSFIRAWLPIYFARDVTIRS